MLATITDFKQKITLIQDSGIQFLDFALKPVWDEALPAKFVRKSANGPLLRLEYNAQSGRHFLPGLDGGAPEVVRPEFSFPLEQSLQLLDQICFRCRFCASIRRAPLWRARITGRGCRSAHLRRRKPTAVRTAW